MYSILYIMQNTEELNDWLSQYQVADDLAGTEQKCMICGSEFTVRKSGFPPRYGICKKCKCSFTSKNRVVTEEQKILQKEKSLQAWNDKSEEDRKNIIEKRRNSLKQTCSNRTKEEKEKIGKHISEVQQNFSKEKKTEISEKKRVAQINYWSNLDDSSREYLRKKNKESHLTENYLNCRLEIQKSRTKEYWKEIRSKSHHSYFYEGLDFDSSWELAVWIYAKDHGLDIEREPIMFEYEINGKVKKYFPDFKLNEDLIEVKGDHFFKNGKMICPFDESLNDIYEAKHQCGLKNKVKFWTSKEMQNILKYIEDKYTKDYLELFKKDLSFPYPELSSQSNDFNIIRYFHKSLYKASRKGKLSPLQAWQDKDLIKKAALNRLKYVGRCTPKDVLQGFNVAKIAPKVSVFKPSLAEQLIKKYLDNYSTIFDPFSGFSGRLIGAANCRKAYTGQDINEEHVKESNEIIKYKNYSNVQVSVQNILTDSEKEYECLFTCPPYGGKEHWNENNDEVEKTCDEWIDICLQKYKCKHYIFVVDKTEKYKDKITEVLENKSHLGISKEYVIFL